LIHASSYDFKRLRHVAITQRGVCSVVLRNTSSSTIASRSMRYTIRQLLSASRMRNSWHLAPIEGIGRAWGMASISPS